MQVAITLQGQTHYSRSFSSGVAFPWDFFFHVDYFHHHITNRPTLLILPCPLWESVSESSGDLKVSHEHVSSTVVAAHICKLGSVTSQNKAVILFSLCLDAITPAISLLMCISIKRSSIRTVCLQAHQLKHCSQQNKNERPWEFESMVSLSSYIRQGKSPGNLQK